MVNREAQQSLRLLVCGVVLLYSIPYSLFPIH
jgi:hypothetical protein